jgi:hypothetical protein
VSGRGYAQSDRASVADFDPGPGRARRQSSAASTSAALAFALSSPHDGNNRSELVRGASGKDVGLDDAGSAATVDAGTPSVLSRPRGPRSIDVYPISLPGSSRDTAADIARASAIWAQCSVSVAMRGGESWQTDVMDLLNPKGVLNEYSNPSSPTIEETTMLAHHPGGSALHAYFVPSMSAGSRGESFWPSMTPSYTAVVISDAAASDSFAHELGHVLLDDGSHDSDPDNLMASGSIRNVGVDKLTAAQCARI